MALDVGKDNSLYIHLTLLPFMRCTNELKTKPTQHSVKQLQSVGIQPDIIICRAEQDIPESARKKIALFCNVPMDCVIESIDLKTIYEVPIALEKQSISWIISNRLKLGKIKPDLTEWSEMVDKILNPANQKVQIGIIGKYVELNDAYKSIIESLAHAGLNNDVDVEIKLISSDELEETGNIKDLIKCDGLLIPGGFGVRGLEGKIRAIQYCRENNIPFFGICLGMQLACIEFARNVLGIKEANTAEAVPENPWNIVDILPEQKELSNMGGTMRLGAYACKLDETSRAYQCYQEPMVYERHRHRYEFCNKFRDVFENGGLRFSGISPDGRLVEIIEIPEHRFFVACQFHPEFVSRPYRPHPLFIGFVMACLEVNCEKSK
jgi:CTP synthase